MKLWGGRFAKQTNAGVDHFNSSISFDQRLYKQDIVGSVAHVKMLSKQAIIPTSDATAIIKGLDDLLVDIENDKITFDVATEDIHMNIETLLIDRIGDVAKKMHTGRSRNDQVALDIRMYIGEEIQQIQELILELQNVLIELSTEHLDTIMPGYTHLQRAQPITFSHHLMAYFQMFLRDYNRLSETSVRTNMMPLGSGALATTTYPLDREYVAEILGFHDITQNSLDGVSDRDFAIELLSDISLLMMHLSRFSEEIILWSSHEFKFIELDDAYSTGSSIMPQKKNPDIAELVRGKCGRVYGNLMALLTTMKGLPLAYNKDMQEDKEGLFDSIDTIKMCLPMFSQMLSTITVNKEQMYGAAAGGFTNATDAADWLVKNGMAFRDAHAVIGKLVLYCIQTNQTLENLTLSEYQEISPLFNDSIYKAISLEVCVNERNITGGPSYGSVEKQIKLGQSWINSL